MEDLYFTSDTHYGHGAGRKDGGGILKHQKQTRPFKTVEEMDEALIANWNQRVKRNDRIYIVGDFSFYGAKETEVILRRLNGQKHLVLGNHDRFASNSDIPKYFKSISQIKEIRVDRQRIVMCHYAMLTWNTAHYGTWQLFGHSHGSLQIKDRLQMDVGVDAVPNLSPISFEEIKAIMSTRKYIPVDHHNARYRE